MPAATPLKLEHQLSSLSMTESQTKDAPSTPGTALITPTKSDFDGDLSFESNEDSSQEEEAGAEAPSSVIQVFEKTDHKLLEERGDFDDEPLLKENPQRFVIFPIQDNDVSKGKRALQSSIFMARTVLTLITLFPTILSSSGKCTKRPKLPSGLRKRLISAVT
jgi:hypothetical protein